MVDPEWEIRLRILVRAEAIEEAPRKVEGLQMEREDEGIIIALGEGVRGRAKVRGKGMGGAEGVMVAEIKTGAVIKDQIQGTVRVKDSKIIGDVGITNGREELALRRIWKGNLKNLPVTSFRLAM